MKQWATRLAYAGALLSAVLCAAAVAACAACSLRGEWLHVEVGRRYWVAGAGIGPGASNFTVYRYRTALITSRPSAKLVRTDRFGWLVGAQRVSGYEVLGAKALRVESDYSLQPGVFLTHWSLHLPHRLAIPATALLPTAYLLCSRRRTHTVGFDPVID